MIRAQLKFFVFLSLLISSVSLPIQAEPHLFTHAPPQPISKEKAELFRNAQWKLAKAWIHIRSLQSEVEALVKERTLLAQNYGTFDLDSQFQNQERVLELDAKISALENEISTQWRDLAPTLHVASRVLGLHTLWLKIGGSLLTLGLIVAGGYPVMEFFADERFSWESIGPYLKEGLIGLSSVYTAKRALHWVTSHHSKKSLERTAWFLEEVRTLMLRLSPNPDASLEVPVTVETVQTWAKPFAPYGVEKARWWTHPCEAVLSGRARNT